ncbi:hypothetical protein IV102_12865 [bacterium]|nr:hypothetical protein [bacterium]
MGQVLRLKFSTDQVLNYALVSKSSQTASQEGKTVGEEKGGFEARLDQNVIRALDDGTAHVVSVTVPKPGPGIPDGARSVIYQHLGARGEVHEVSGPNQGNAFAFPEAEVTAGATWEGQTQTQLPNVPTPVTMKYIYTYECDEEMKGTDCVRISFTSEPVEFQVPLPDGRGASNVKTASDGTMWFDNAKGCLIKLELTTRTKPQVGPMSFDIENQTVQELI